MANQIKKLIEKGISLSKVAILTRASFQFKDIEDRFIRENLKYKVVGGLRFYERAEIKDALAYFRLLLNSEDNLAFERIINIPRRGIGAVFIKNLYKISVEKKLSLYESLKIFTENGKAQKSVQKNIHNFLLIYNKHKKMLSEENHSDVAGSLLDDIGYTEMLQNEKTIESEGRLENLKKLVVDIKNRRSIGEFLEEVSLLTENINQKDEEDKTSLMTLHSAKGLEFDYVFLPGWEEGIFPNQRNIDEYGNKGLEEERRLAYVGITRARRKLFISFVNFRKQYNYNLYRSIPSRFISELPKKSCNLIFEKSSVKSERKPFTILSNNKFSVGDFVLHSEFGKGKVLGVNGKKLQIKFENNSGIINIFSDFVKKTDAT